MQETGILLGGPIGAEDPNDETGKFLIAIDPVETAPGWEIYYNKKRTERIPDNLTHVYQSEGEKDWRGRWKFKYIGGFTARAFANRLQEGAD